MNHAYFLVMAALHRVRPVSTGGLVVDAAMREAVPRESILLGDDTYADRFGDEVPRVSVVSGSLPRSTSKNLLLAREAPGLRYGQGPSGLCAIVPSARTTSRLRAAYL
ncbi:hypothetical protein [Stenotrophomonas tuberculopleuritidis]|uniref:hypothetical protein n=1 Tax=Stenotrophomonas tuberculopleuritidis TaxID=3055079 RepID=UPI0026E526C4|nr:hypothetical protein [Stenotrophomonas sp. 704A1]